MLKKTVIILVIILIAAGAAGGYIYHMLKSDAVAQPGSVYIPDGAGFEQLVDSLEAGGLLRDIGKFRTTAKLADLDGEVKPGHYMVKSGAGYLALARMFARGLQTPVRVTFNNIRLLPNLAGRIAQQLEPDSAAFAPFLTSAATAEKYGFAPRTFISMFIPNTYELYWTTSPEGFADRMKTEYDRFWEGARDEKRKTLNLSREEVSVLASIVYEETKMSDEMPAVAGVYVNRLRKGMPLQADPTVKFAVGDPTLRRILYRHLEVDSPYNTYKYAGLPPGPICMPSVAAIDAVLNYKKHDYLYFCARPDFSGYHNFATTLAQHNRNRDAWVQALNRAGIR